MDRTYGYIEGYAAALYDMLCNLDPDFDGSGKSYDPAYIWEDKVHSYVFNLKDGGRHHSLSDYKSLEELLTYFLAETLQQLPSHEGVTVETVKKIDPPFSLQEQLPWRR